MDSTVLLAILLAVAGTAMATLLIQWLVKHTKMRVQAQQDFAVAMKDLTKVVGVLADVPKMIAGHAAAAGAMVVEVSKLREAVVQFSKIVTRPEPTPGEPPTSFVAYADENKADEAFLITQKWAEDPTQTFEQVKRAAEEELARRDSMPSPSME